MKGGINENNNDSIGFSPKDLLEDGAIYHEDNMKIYCQSQDLRKPQAVKISRLHSPEPKLKDDILIDKQLFSAIIHFICSAASAGAIDNKIEQAMDIVKGHLLMAVREEVEVLKEQISELLDANEKLREENTRLRKEKGSSQSGSQLLQHMSTSAQESQYQGIPPNPATQMHTPSSYHQHSLPGQQQQQMPSSTSTGAPTEQPHYQQPPAHHHHPQAQSVESAAQPQYQHIPDTSVVDQTTYTHAIPSQPSTVTTNTEQYHQAPGQPLQEGQYPIQQQVTTTPSSLSKSLTRSLNQSQYQHGPPMGMPHASSDQGQYQAVQPHHQIGASQEHSQAVPPAGAIPHTQHGTTQPRIPHSQGERQGHL